MEIPLLIDVAILLGLSMLVVFISLKVRLPVIVGLLITGVVVGPYGLQLIHAIEEVEIMAEVGVVLLLFTIGLEFSLNDLIKLKRISLVGGALQVGISIGVAYVMAITLGVADTQAIFLGFLFALSSTAIVLKIIQERAEMDAPHGQTAVAILIFQDIIVVVMMIITPLLAGSFDELGNELLILTVQGVAIIVVVGLAAKYVVPKVLHQIAQTRSRELFLLSVVGICMIVAGITSNMGLSLGLGAFLAGLCISESEYSAQALGGIIPFKDIFTSFFFISIGMLFNLQVVFAEPVLVMALSAGVILVKAVIITSICMLLGLHLRTSIISGLSLSQIGEFSFVLSKVGLSSEVLSNEYYQLFLAVSIVTMTLTPFLITGSHRLADWVVKKPIPPKLIRGFNNIPVQESSYATGKLENHIIIIGFGLNGKHLAQAAREASIPYVVLEMNPDTVRSERKKGEPIIYGDATHMEILEHAHVKKARVVVIAISDPAGTRQVLQNVRHLNKDVFVIVRTRFVNEMEELYNSGANEVIPEEFETAVEIFTRVLTKYLVPEQEIEQFAEKIREGGYRMFRSLPKKSTDLEELHHFMNELELKVLKVPENSDLVGKTLEELNLRNNYGVTLLAIRRKDETIVNPKGDTKLEDKDHLFVMGQKERLYEFKPFVSEDGEG